MHIDLDMRFVDSLYELVVLKEVIEILKNKLAEAKGKIEKQVDWQMNGELDESERQELIQRRDVMMDEILPKYFINPIIISLWALFESTVIEVSEYIKKKKSIPPTVTIQSTKGYGFLEKVDKFYSDALKFLLFRDRANYSFLEITYTIRNSIAHNNGRLETAKYPEDKVKIINWSKDKQIGIEIQSGYVICSEVFFDRAYNVVHAQLTELIDRVKTDFSGY